MNTQRRMFSISCTAWSVAAYHRCRRMLSRLRKRLTGERTLFAAHHDRAPAARTIHRDGTCPIRLIEHTLRDRDRTTSDVGGCDC